MSNKTANRWETAKMLCAILAIVLIASFINLGIQGNRIDEIESDNLSLQKANEDLQTRYDFAIGKFRETIKSASIILAKSGLELPENCGVKKQLEVDDEHHMLETIENLLDCLDSAMELSEDIKESLVTELTDAQVELLEVQVRLRMITQSLERCETMAGDGTHVYKKATCKRWRTSAFRWKNQVKDLEEQLEILKKENEALRNNQKPGVPAPVLHRTPVPFDRQVNDPTGRSK